ncbi:MAG: S8 family serine peptidase [Rudaea sp.]
MQSKFFHWALPFVAVVGIALSIPAQAQTWSSKAIEPGSLESLPSILPDASNVDAVDAKIHAQLRDALDAKARGVAASSLTHLPSALVRNDQVLVEVHFRDDESASTATDILQRHGATLRNRLSDALHEVWIPLDRLREFAAEADVASIIPARLARPVIGSKLSQGVAAGNANYWQTFVPAYDGTGINIAMIDSYDASTIPALQASGDWPPNTRLTKNDFKTYPAPIGLPACATPAFGCLGIGHGNATLEIAYDVAPGATFLAYDTETVGDWRNAILDAAHLNVNGAPVGTVKANVISASLAAPLDGKGDGTALPGSIAEAAGFAKAQGVLVVNAAGNERENHWGGLFQLASSGNGFHTWNGSNTIYNPFGDGAGIIYCVGDGATIDVEMYWNNWTTPGSTHNYDLNLYQDSSTNGIPNWGLLPVAQSNNLQNGGSGQTPQEIIQYTAVGGATGGCPAHSAAYAIAVARVAGTTAFDNLQVFASTSEGQPLNFDVTSRSLVFPADSPNVLSVAAIDVANATKNPQELFSSEGPVLGTGGDLPTNTDPATDPNLKPDLASFDDVTTVTIPTFFGTSASAPHAAGMAALFMQKFGTPTTSANLTSTILTPLRAISLTGSNDLGTVGKDYQYGYGRLRFQKDASLYFLQQPSNAAVNTTIVPPVKIGVLDTEGKPDLYPLYTGVTLGLGNNPGGGALTGGGAALFVQGVATYSALKINQGGTGYTLSATSTPNGLTATSAAFNITTGAASKLVFTVQPTNVIAGHPISPAVQVSVEDANGNLVTAGSFQLTLKKIGCTTATPSGGGPIATTNGVVSFPALTLNTMANGVQLQAIANGLSTATSQSFNVTKNVDVVFANGFEVCKP